MFSTGKRSMLAADHHSSWSLWRFRHLIHADKVFGTHNGYTNGPYWPETAELETALPQS
jgi:hypothetical protein